MRKNKKKTKIADKKNFSEKGVEAVKKNLKVQRKHGAFEFLSKGVAPVPNCGQCVFAKECEYYKPNATQCGAILELQGEICDELLRLKYIRPEDKFLVDRFVKNFCFLIIVEKWIANVGPFQISKEGIDVQPILKIKTSYERLVLKQADALGIGPQARARLNLTTVTAFNFAEALQKAKPITNQTAKIIADENREQSDN
jgi:hypothetical protein